MSIGNFCLIRKRKPVERWANPAVAEYFPKWLVKLTMPGQPAKSESSKLPICAECMVAEAPARDRAACKCQKPVRQWATEWLKTEERLFQDGRIAELRSMREVKTAPTVDEAERVYMANIPASQKESGRKNWRCLRAILLETTGKSPGPQRLTALTRELLLTWIRLRQAWYAGGKVATWDKLRERLAAGELPGVDRKIARPGNNTINSYINCAQSALGDTARSYYLHGLDIPPLTDFLAVTALPGIKGYVPIPAEDYARLHAAHTALRETDPQLWLVIALLRQLGGRSKEVALCRESWLERTAAGVTFILKNRPEEEFFLKARDRAIERRLPLSADLVTAIDKVKAMAEATAADRLRRKRKHPIEGSLIGAETKTEAVELVYRKASKWLRTFLPGRKSTAHELRKWLGAEIYSREGSATAAAMLGHATPDVTNARYAAPTMRLPMIDQGRLLPRQMSHGNLEGSMGGCEDTVA